MQCDEHQKPWAILARCPWASDTASLACDRPQLGDHSLYHVPSRSLPSVRRMGWLLQMRHSYGRGSCSMGLGLWHEAWPCWLGSLEQAFPVERLTFLPFFHFQRLTEVGSQGS